MVVGMVPIGRDPIAPPERCNRRRLLAGQGMGSFMGLPISPLFPCSMPWGYLETVQLDRLFASSQDGGQREDSRLFHPPPANVSFGGIV